MRFLVPSRGRPGNIERLISRCAETCRTDYQLCFGFDDDDPCLEANIKAAGGWPYEVRPRMGLAAWTNHLAMADLSVPYLASVGDDMTPETDGWDESLVAAIDRMGGGFAYPAGTRYPDHPECWAQSSAIARALGWMALPGAEHWYIDNTISDLGQPDRLAFLPDVTVRHRHANAPGGDPPDQTYWDAAGHFGHDMAAWQRWRLTRMAADRETVRRACEAAS
ncbi:MAG TPA: hypothetical protein VEH31_43830 [Streptosporangiaceae bacterium]|nr:hypothetical protein [Streptosporangiaceae bacterium]